MSYKVYWLLCNTVWFIPDCKRVGRIKTVGVHKWAWPKGRVSSLRNYNHLFVTKNHEDWKQRFTITLFPNYIRFWKSVTPRLAWLCIHFAKTMILRVPYRCASIRSTKSFKSGASIDAPAPTPLDCIYNMHILYRKKISGGESIWCLWNYEF